MCRQRLREAAGDPVGVALSVTPLELDAGLGELLAEHDTPLVQRGDLLGEADVVDRLALGLVDGHLRGRPGELRRLLRLRDELLGLSNA